MTPDAVAAIYERLKRSKVDQTISSGDDMWRSGADWYFPVGESAALVILHALAMAPLEKVETILDVPCGHGRVARYLRAAFPEEAITFCDLDRVGVDFCSKTFRGHGVYSVPDLAEVRLPGSFDVIWVGSLFTHVDQRRTEEWLKFLSGHLSERGVLVATFHGRRSLEIQRTHPLTEDDRWQEILRDVERTGYGYSDHGVPIRGSGKLVEFAGALPGGRAAARRAVRLVQRPRGYGISLCKPEKIVEIACSIPGMRLLSFSERAWADNHDVVALTRSR